MVRMLGRYFLSFPRPIDVNTLALPIPVHPTRLGTHLGRRQRVDLPAHRRVQKRQWQRDTQAEGQAAQIMSRSVYPKPALRSGPFCRLEITIGQKSAEISQKS